MLPLLNSLRARSFSLSPSMRSAPLTLRLKTADSLVSSNRRAPDVVMPRDIPGNTLSILTLPIETPALSATARSTACLITSPLVLTHTL